MNFDPYFWRQHRASIAKHYRQWQITRLPGFSVHGESLTAFCASRPYHRYWQFKLEYDELDYFPMKESNRFITILENIGPYQIGEIFNRHRDEIASSAILSHGGWRWWGGHGLSLSLVDELRNVLVERYTKASQIMAE